MGGFFPKVILADGWTDDRTTGLRELDIVRNCGIQKVEENSRQGKVSNGIGKKTRIHSFKVVGPGL